MVVCSHNDRRIPLQETKKKPRKTEPCERCGKGHFSEAARYRCLVASEKQTCKCERYWRKRWVSHQPGCPLRGEERAELEQDTEEEIAARESKSAKSTVRRKQ